MQDPTAIVASMPLLRAIRWAAIAAILILIVAGITLAFYLMAWNWAFYGVIMGVIFGLLVGLVILVTVSTKVQMAAVGAVTGMGIDLATTATQKDGPATALNSLASFVAKTVHAAGSAAQQTGLPNPLELPLTVGLWVFIGVLAITMLIGSLEKDAT